MSDEDVQYVEITADTEAFDTALRRVSHQMMDFRRMMLATLVPSFVAMVKVMYDILRLLDGRPTGERPYGGHWSRWQMRGRRR